MAAEPMAAPARAALPVQLGFSGLSVMKGSMKSRRSGFKGGRRFCCPDGRNVRPVDGRSLFIWPVLSRRRRCGQRQGGNRSENHAHPGIPEFLPPRCGSPGMLWARQ